MAEPRFPVELEREIFELTARLHSKCIPALLLVAHRVKIWVTPILYRVVVVYSYPLPVHLSFHFSHFISAIQSQPISEHIRNLLIANDLKAPPSPSDLMYALASCSAVQNLALPYGVNLKPEHLPLLSAMPLRRLCISLTPRDAIDFFHSPFLHLTHLEIRDYIEHAPWAQWKGLALIPNLTHLAFLLEKFVAIFEGALAACPRLQVLVYLYPRRLCIGLEQLAHDIRFVCIRAPNFVADWQIGASGGDDFWVRAKKFIVQRNSGEVDRGNFLLQES
ncbi:hypothetical protein K438DRAFT_1932688 [Mycena galopus ATCC 62051]|nr:hypothetical protein K438DRAFT_1932688 [Mycena galopus ATCC 62051]